MTCVISGVISLDTSRSPNMATIDRKYLLQTIPWLRDSSLAILQSNSVSLISSQGIWKCCFHHISLIIDWTDLLLTWATHWHGSHHDNDQVIMITLIVMIRSDIDSDSHMWKCHSHRQDRSCPFKALWIQWHEWTNDDKKKTRRIPQNLHKALNQQL